MKKIRCAIYTRKSAEEGLEQEFNSLDAQREACAAYVASQKAEGWVLLPTVYEDAGLSGGTLERPGLQRLLADIDAGLVDQIVVYKVDRRRLRCLLLVMCTHPFAKKALTLHLARSEGHERYFGCNLMHRKVLASSHQHLMTEAPGLAAGACEPFRHFYHELHRKPHDLCAGAESRVL